MPPELVPNIKKRLMESDWDQANESVREAGRAY